MPVNSMHRRRFFQMATAAVSLPFLARPGLAAFASAPTHDYLFVDERFQRARRVVADWAGASALVSVQGDVTATWIGGLDRAARERPLLLRGVTTDSFRFCLEVLLREHAELTTQVSRLDRDLIHWSMKATPRSGYGAHA